MGNTNDAKIMDIKDTDKMLEDSPFLNKIMQNIEEFYGVHLGDSGRYAISTRIFNTVLVNRFLDLPYRYNIEHKGKIVKGELRNIDLKDILALYTFNGGTEVKNTEDCLLPLSDQLTYCEDNGKIYYGIDKDIANYLSKHNIGGVIYDIVGGVLTMPTVYGETVKVYDMFIKKCKTIALKGAVLVGNEDTSDELSQDNPFVALHYVESLLSGESIQEFASKREEISKIAESSAKLKDIIAEDLQYRYRYKKIMNFVDALELGVQEAVKYGFKYTQQPDNSNFIVYLKYLAHNEE